MKKAILIMFVILAMSGMQSYASQSARQGRIDPRIRTFVYDEGQVYVINAAYGIETHITLGKDEVIEHASAGDTAAWHVVPIKNHIFIMPKLFNADTNLVVLTNIHRYNFELRAKRTQSIRDKDLTFAVSFEYPEKELRESLRRSLAESKQAEKVQFAADQVISPEETGPWQWNMNYTRKGDKSLAPTQVFDDGKHTYFQFPKEMDTPAIFQVGDDKNESLVNYHAKGKYIVVHRIAKQFVLRHGKQATCIFNKSYKDMIEPTKVPENAGGEVQHGG